MTHGQALKPKRRFQFSLRTLMLAVIIYGGLWLLTIKWGANQIRSDLNRVYDDNTSWIPKGDGGFSYRMPDLAMKMDSVAQVPLPFVVVWTTDFDSGYFRDQSEHRRRVYLWFFGAYKCVSETTKELTELSVLQSRLANLTKRTPPHFQNPSNSST